MIISGIARAEHEAQERLVHIHIEQDPLKPVTSERQHEQNVAIYDLLDENSFAVIDQTGPYHLYLKTDLRHIYFDVRDSREDALSGFVMALGPFRRIMREYHLVCTSYYEAIRTKSRRRFRPSIWVVAACIMKGRICLCRGWKITWHWIMQPRAACLR